MIGELIQRGIPCRRQPEYQLYYKEHLVGGQRLDLFVAQDVVVELKVAEALAPLHKAQTFSYLKVVDKQIGLTFNFGSSTRQFERLYYRDRQTETLSSPAVHEWSPDFRFPELTHDVIGALYEVHAVLGPGFFYHIYANALYHELRLRSLEVRPRRVYEVIYQDRSVGAIKFSHLEINGCLMVFPVAMQNIDELSLNNLKAWLRDQNMSLGIIANFYPVTLEFMVLRP